MQGEDEQNKTEEASHYKLDQARKKGSVARGTDLSFLSGIVALLLFVSFAGSTLIASLTAIMEGNFAVIADAVDPTGPGRLISQDATNALRSIVFLGVIVVLVVIPVEIVQLRGFMFTAAPLTPDFTRLNPAKGFKRLFSRRTIKEAGKSLVKFALYAGLAALTVTWALTKINGEVAGAAHLIGLMKQESVRLVILFALAALAVAIIDQLMARKEFARQMRMSRREMTREHKEREGEPRIRQKRKELHSQFASQTAGVGNLGGSDMLIVNPDHFAVALEYRPTEMMAPQIRARARNLLALEMKKRAFALGIAVIEDPPLARALFRSGRAGDDIPTDYYRPVALHYSTLRARAQREEEPS